MNQFKKVCLLTLIAVSFLWLVSFAQSDTAKQSLPVNALYTIDGKQSTKEEVEKLDKKLIRSVDVWKGEEAVKKFGERGKNGVVMISTTASSDYDKLFTKVEQPASFPDGEEGWKNYMDKQLQYPEAAKTNKTEGTVRLQIVIDKSGTLTEIRALEDPGNGLAAEAMRLVRRGPKWIPAKVNGNDVNYRFVFPVTFKL